MHISDIQADWRMQQKSEREEGSCPGPKFGTENDAYFLVLEKSSSFGLSCFFPFDY